MEEQPIFMAQKKQIKERLNASAVSFQKLSQAELNLIKKTLTKHLKQTKSAKAKRLLDHWEKEIKKLFKIDPKTS